MPRFNNRRALEAHIKRALDATVAQTIIQAQADLGSTNVSPYDTGRFRSSWFVSEGNASEEVAPEGTDSPRSDAESLVVNSDREYHLTNSLPYAQAIAIEGRVVSQPKTWFTDFVNVRMPKIQEAAAGLIKREYDL